MATEHHRPQITTTEVPPDMLYHNILPRLPARSLHRFRYVCKQWHSFLTSPEFIKSHTHHVTTDHHQNHHKLLLLSTTTPCNVHTIDCESPENSLTPNRRPFPFKINPQNMTILTSFNGLVCVGITRRRYDDNYSDLILWNPVTGDFKKLSESNPECYEVTGRAYGLYYSHSDDDYKLLRVTHSYYAYIYSLKSDSWRMVRYYIGSLVSETWGESNILHNEKLYFLKKGKVATNYGRMIYSIIRFDMKTERFTEIATPSVVEVRTCLDFTLLHKDGRIHLCVIYHKANCTDLGAKLWRMDGDEDGDWTEVASYPILPNLYCFQKPVYLMRNGNWLTYCLHSGCHVYKLDLVRNLSEISYSSIDRSMDITPSGIYIETLVSPNRYMKYRDPTRFLIRR